MSDIRKFVIEVTPWLNDRDAGDPVQNWQWDVYVNGEWWGGGTGPDNGNPALCASFAVDHWFENGYDHD